MSQARYSILKNVPVHDRMPFIPTDLTEWPLSDAKRPWDFLSAVDLDVVGHALAREGLEDARRGVLRGSR